jgi:hypothetical protein
MPPSLATATSENSKGLVSGYALKNVGPPESPKHTITYHVVRDEVVFRDLGRDYFDRLNSNRQKLALRRLQALGCDISHVT